MPLQYDWGEDVNGDLDISDNDFTYVFSDQTHIEDTCKAFPLWWKQFPADGVGIDAYRKSAGKMQKLMGAIKSNLQGDGYNCTNPKVIQNANGVYQIWTNAIRT